VIYQQERSRCFLLISKGPPACSSREEGLSLDRMIGDKEGIAVSSLLLAWADLKQGGITTARTRMEESLDLYRQMEHREGTAESLSMLGKVEEYRDDNVFARTLYEESLAIAREIGDKELIASGLERLAGVVAMQGEPAWAVHLWGAAEALREEIGAPLLPIERADYDHAVAAARNQLGGNLLLRHGRRDAPCRQSRCSPQGKERFSHISLDEAITILSGDASYDARSMQAFACG
jgi:hypothetical protein